MATSNSENSKETQWDLWEVFVQSQDGAPHEHAGSVHAPDPEMALQNARDVYSRRGKVISMWVWPSRSSTASYPEERGALFEPGYDKVYRHPQFYKTQRGVKLD